MVMEDEKTRVWTAKWATQLGGTSCSNLKEILLSFSVTLSSNYDETTRSKMILEEMERRKKYLIHENSHGRGLMVRHAGVGDN